MNPGVSSAIRHPAPKAVSETSGNDLRLRYPEIVVPDRGEADRAVNTIAGLFDNAAPNA